MIRSETKIIRTRPYVTNYPILNSFLLIMVYHFDTLLNLLLAKLLGWEREEMMKENLRKRNDEEGLDEKDKR